MKRLNIKKPGAGFYLIAASLILTIVGFCFFFSSYDVFGFVYSRWVIALTVLALWSMVVLLANGLYGGEHPVWITLFYLIIVFGLAVSAIEFIKPGLGNIATYFTVNMGDMETYAIAVPRTITGVVMYVLATVCAVIASFFRMTLRSAEEKRVSADGKGE